MRSIHWWGASQFLNLSGVAMVPKEQLRIARHFNAGQADP
jgi:hypothetical protein